MAEENREQEPAQEEEQLQESVQEPAEEPQNEPAKKKRDSGGLLMPILYALLAAVGAFTLIMIIGIVVTFLTRPAQPSESPSTEPPSPSPVQAQVPYYRLPDLEDVISL